MNVSKVLMCFLFALVSLSAHAEGELQDPAVDESQNLELKKLEKELQAVLISGYANAHPRVQDLKKQIDTLKRKQAIRGGLSGEGSPFATLQSAARTAFWRNPEWVELLGLTTDQQNKMDETFQQFRLKLIDNKAVLDKEEIILEPMLKSDVFVSGNESKVLMQIDRIAEARAELEKTNSRMILSLLKVLTPEQWSKLPVGNPKPAAVRSTKQ